MDKVRGALTAVIRVLQSTALVMTMLAAAADALGPHALAASFYVDNSCAENGNGRAEGCASSPGANGAWNSLDAAQNCQGMLPGDHLQIRAGTGVYNEGWYATMTPDPNACSGTATNPIIFENYPHENVVLDGAHDIKGNLSKWTAVGNGVYLCNSGTCGPIARWPFMAWYRIANGTEQEIYLQHTSRVCDSTVPPGWMRYTEDGAVCVHLRENVSPGSDAVDYFKTNITLAAGIQLHVRPGVKHWRVRKNPLGGSFTIKRYRDYGVVATSEVNIDIGIDGLNIGYMMDRCVNFDTGLVVAEVGWQLLNSHIHHCGQEGVHAGGDSSASFRVQNNVIDHIQSPPYVERCDERCSFAMDRGTAVRVAEVAASTTALVRGNDIHDSCGGYQDGRCNGINVEYGGANLTIENNLIWNLAIQMWPFGGHGLLFSQGPCTDCAVRNNRFYNVDVCIAFENDLDYSYAMAIYNNTCVNPWYSAIASEYGDALGTIAITNNIFYSTTAPQGALVIIPRDSMGVLTPTHNAFYCAFGCQATDFRGALYHGAAIEGLGVGNRWGDPNINTIGLPPLLNINSPAGAAYRNGVVLVPAFPDYLNTPRPSFGVWDIGAHEYVGTSAPAASAIPGLVPLPR